MQSQEYFYVLIWLKIPFILSLWSIC